MISPDWRGGLVAPLAVVLLAVWSQPAGAQQERVSYAGGSGGWAVPTGSVSSLSDLISFPSVPARDLYKPGLAIGLMGGIAIKGWLVEGAIDMRLSPMTALGDTLVNLTSPAADREVGVEYASFEVFGARHFGTGPLEKIGLRPFAGVSMGATLLQLNAGTGVEPYNDEGFEMGAKFGMDWIAGPPAGIMFRAAARYQLFSVGVEIPHDWIYHFGVGYQFR